MHPTLLALLVWSLPLAAFSMPLSTSESTATGPHLRSPKNADPFMVAGPLRKNVDFWIKIYSQYTTQEGVIHDAKYIDRVYEVLDLRSVAHPTKKIKAAKTKWREILRRVHTKRHDPSRMTEEERKVFEMFQDINEPNKFIEATSRKRLRFQLGQKDRFLEGMRESGRYLAHMEEIFAREQLPLELVRLPFVESSFNLRARSKVGASGIWQFMRSTGRLYLRINDAIDERNDPIRATEAAARLLKMNYEMLKNWPLAVTAYNHGPHGMARAVKKTGTEDLEELIQEYRSRRFGFASSNFFASFLAAVEVEKNAEKYFGKVERAQPLQFFEVEIPDRILLKDLCSFLKLDAQEIERLNPGLHNAVFSGRKRIPGGSILRLPFDGKGEKEAAAQRFMAGYNLIPALYKQKDHFRRKYGTGGKPNRSM